jgi:hypothetical protein
LRADRKNPRGCRNGCRYFVDGGRENNARGAAARDMRRIAQKRLNDIGIVLDG